MEPRSATCARLRIRPVAEPGLSIIGYFTLGRLLHLLRDVAALNEPGARGRYLVGVSR